MSDALDMFWCDKCATYYVPVERGDGRTGHRCHIQTVVGSRFFSAPGELSRGSVIDQEV